MTAPLLMSYLETSSTRAFLGCHSTTSVKSANKTPHPSPTYLSHDRDSANHPISMPEISGMLGGLMDLLPQGVMVVSRNLKPVYWNQKAKQLCRVFANGNSPDATLPFIISEIAHRFIRENLPPGRSLILEHQTPHKQTLRFTASWLELPGKSFNAQKFSNPLLLLDDTTLEASEERPEVIAVFLENCDEVMQKEMQIQQEKYDLTDREVEIWMLIRQEYTYLEIAQRLQISLNTVKTHVKNVYAKRRSYQETEKFWCHNA